MKIVNKEFVDLDGNSLRETVPESDNYLPPAQRRQPGDMPIITVGSVLVNAALAPPANPSAPYSAGANAARYTLAVAAHKACIGEEIDLNVHMPDVNKSFDLTEEILQYVRARFGPIISGPLEIALSEQH